MPTASNVFIACPAGNNYPIRSGSFEADAAPQDTNNPSAKVVGYLAVFLAAITKRQKAPAD